MIVPKFLEAKPKPVIETRLYHRSRVPLWRGFVRLSKVQGWAENPRLQLEMKRWKSDFAGTDIDQDALYDLMKKTKDIKLKELAANIAYNGLREPIVLTYDGKLLDGNRRFFAVKFAYDSAKDATKKAELETIPAFVLTENATDDEIHNILVEENFSPSLKEPWPYYVKAEIIRQEDENGLSKSDIAAKYGWTPQDVSGTLKIGEITDDFMTYATEAADSDEGGLGLSALDAESVVAEYYQFFNEAKKSLHKHLIADRDFAELFYKLIAQKDFFNRWDEVRCAYDGYQHSVGRVILERGESGGGKDLKALIQIEKSNLKERQGVEERIAEFVRFLRAIKTKQIEEVSDEALNGLQESLTLVQKLMEAAKKHK